MLFGGIQSSFCSFDRAVGLAPVSLAIGLWDFVLNIFKIINFCYGFGVLFSLTSITFH